MVEKSTLYLLLVGLCFLLEVKGQSPCLSDNGGCSHYCLDRGDGQASCSCPCLMTLDSNNLTCVAIVACNIDMVIITDISRMTDPFSCLSLGIIGSGGLNPYEFWTNWRDHCADIIDLFAPENAGSQWRIGVQLFTSQQTYNNINDYADLDLSSTTATLRAMAEPDCGGEVHYTFYLGADIEDNPGFTNHVYRGPGTRRDPTDTTRVALALISEAVDISLEQVMVRMEDIMTGMDEILVVSQATRADPLNPEAVIRNEAINRQVACGNSTANPCPDYFYVDQDNDLGLAATKANLLSRIDTSSCVGRRLEANPVEATTTCDNQMMVTIPGCLLAGLGISDLTFLDPDCVTSSFGSESGGNITLTVPFIGCGIMTSLDPDSGETIFSQNVITRIYSASQVLPDVNISISCSYPTATPGPREGDYTGAMQSAPVKDMGDDFYSMSFVMSLNSDFSNPLAPMSPVTVDCPVYALASNDLAANFDLQLVSCVATSSSSPTTPNFYSLYADGCAFDPTFQFLSDPNGVSFKFDFFEFASTYKMPSASKLPVYIHCEFTACAVGDSSAACNPIGCVGRRKRGVEDSEDTVIRTLGPFMVENSKGADSVIEVAISSGHTTSSFALYDDFVLAVAAGVILMMVAVVYMIQKRQVIKVQNPDLFEKKCPPEHYVSVVTEKSGKATES